MHDKDTLVHVVSAPKEAAALVREVLGTLAVECDLSDGSLPV